VGWGGGGPWERCRSSWGLSEPHLAVQRGVTQQSRMVGRAGGLTGALAGACRRPAGVSSSALVWQGLRTTRLGPFLSSLLQGQNMY